MSFSIVPGKHYSLYYYTEVYNSLCSILRASSVFWSQSKCLTLPWNGYRMRQPLHRVTYSMFCGWDRLLFALSLARPTRTFQVWMTYKQCQMLWVLPPLRALSCVTCVILAAYVLQFKNVFILCAWKSMNKARHDVVAIEWILTTAPVLCPIWAKVSHGKAAGSGQATSMREVPEAPHDDQCMGFLSKHQCRSMKHYAKQGMTSTWPKVPSSDHRSEISRSEHWTYSELTAAEKGRHSPCIILFAGLRAEVMCNLF